MSGYSMWAQSKIKIVNNSLLNKQLAIFYQPFITEYIKKYVIQHRPIYIYIYMYGVISLLEMNRF